MTRGRTGEAVSWGHPRSWEGGTFYPPQGWSRGERGWASLLLRPQVGGLVPLAATGTGAWHAEWERPRGGFTNGIQTFLDVVHVFQEGEGVRKGVRRAGSLGRRCPE